MIIVNLFNNNILFTHEESLFVIVSSISPMSYSLTLASDRPEAGLPATYQPEFGLGRRTSRDAAGS